MSGRGNAIEQPELVEPVERSYGEAVKSSAFIGGAVVIELVFRMIRTKAFALMIGPSGVGILGIYSNIAEVIRNLAGLGITESGIREIANAAGSDDVLRVRRATTALRRVAWASGFAGALLLLALSHVVSNVTFGGGHHVWDLLLLACTIPLLDLADAQQSIVQGLRRISDLSRMIVLGGFVGSACAIPVVYVLGERGLAVSLLVVALARVVISNWYARKVDVEPVAMTFRETLECCSGLLKMGLSLMTSGVVLMGSSYLVRLVVVRQLGLDAAGFFQAAWSLGSLYTGLIFRAMAADFLPRLTGVVDDHKECNRLVNEQSEVVFLLALPGAVGTFTFAPLIVEVFYSSQFGPSVLILRWICLGMTLKIASWSMQNIIWAKGEHRIYFLSELLSNLALLLFVFLSVREWGLPGVGVSFFGMYLLYAAGMVVAARRLTGFRFAERNVRMLQLFLPILAATFVASLLLPSRVFFIVGGGMTLLTTAYSLRTLSTLVGSAWFPAPLRRLGTRLGVLDTNAE